MLSTRQAAEYLGMSYCTLVKRWKWLGLKPYRVGGCLKFRERDLEAWLEDRRAS